MIFIKQRILVNALLLLVFIILALSGTHSVFAMGYFSHSEHCNLPEAALSSSFEEAVPIQTNQPVIDHLPGISRVNYYRFIMPDDGVVGIDFEHVNLTGSDRGWVITLYTPDSYELEQFVSHWNDLKVSSANIGLPRGEYYVRVHAPSGPYATYSDSDYTLTVNYTASDYWEKEPNNTIADVTPIFRNQTYSGSINRPSDKDYYVVELPADGYVSMDFEHDNLTHNYKGWRIRLLSEDSLILETIESWWHELKVSSANIGLPQGRYYVLVELVSGPYYSHNNADYRITLNHTASNYWEKEPNNTIADATHISVNQAYQGSLNYITDVDYYHFHLETGGTINLDFAHDNLTETVAGWEIALFDDSSGELLSFISKLNERLVASEDIEIPRADYFIRVRFPSGPISRKFSNADYTLTVNAPHISPVDPDPVPPPDEDDDDQYFTVRFDLNGAPGTPPASQTVIFGGRATRPPVPPWEGYIFRGWYQNRIGSGLPEFHYFNNYQGWKVKSDLNLYAKWEESDLRETDHYRFANDKAYFSSTYRISDEYYDLLTAGLWPWEKMFFNRVRDKEFLGSCYGMGVSMALLKDGLLEPGFFQSGATRIGDLTCPVNHTDDPFCPDENITVESLVNYYQLAHNFPASRENAKSFIFKSTQSKLHELVAAVNENSWTLIVIQCNTPGMDGGHLVIGHMLEDIGAYYKVHLLESNAKQNDSFLLVSKDYSAATFRCQWRWDGINTADNTLNISSVKCISSYDDINIQELLRSRDGTVTPASAGAAGTANFVELKTNYHRFTITNQAGNSSFVDGTTISGDVEISPPMSAVQPGFDGVENIYYLHSITGYTITPIGSGQSYQTAMLFHTPSGSYSSLESEHKAEVTFCPGGVVEAVATEHGEMKLSTTIDMAPTPWYTVEVAANIERLTLTPSPMHTEISSNGELGMLSVAVYNDQNRIPLDFYTAENLVRVESAGSAHTAYSEPGGGLSGGSGYVSVTAADGSILSDTPLVYAASFKTYGGSAVETVRGLPYNSFVSRPADPYFPGFKFDGWYKDAQCSDGWEWDFAGDRITADTVIHAKWIEDDNSYHEVRFVAAGHDDIVIKVIDRGKIDPVPAVPHKEGYTGYWDVNDFTEIREDMIVTAVYVLGEDLYTVTVVANPQAGGIVSGGGTFGHGAPVSVTAMPNEGYEFISWAEQGVTLASSPTYNFTVSADRYLTANFRFSGEQAETLIYWQNSITGIIDVWVMEGYTRTGREIIDPPSKSTDWRIAAVSDLSSNGSPDLIWESDTSTRRVIWLMNGLKKTGEIDLGYVSTNFRVADTYDMDGDGYEDIIWENWKFGSRNVWFMNNITREHGRGFATAGILWRIAAVDDMGADGRTNIIWEHIVKGERSYWTLDENYQRIVEESGLFYRTGTDWSIAAVHDFNGDGKPDILWQHTDGRRSLWLMDGVNQEPLRQKAIEFRAPEWVIVGCGNMQP